MAALQTLWGWLYPQGQPAGGHETSSICSLSSTMPFQAGEPFLNAAQAGKQNGFATFVSKLGESEKPDQVIKPGAPPPLPLHPAWRLACKRAEATELALPGPGRERHRSRFSHPPGQSLHAICTVLKTPATKLKRLGFVINVHTDPRALTIPFELCQSSRNGPHEALVHTPYRKRTFHCHDASSKK